MKASSNSSLKTFFFILLVFATVPIFAQGIVPQGMTNLMDNILEIFTSGLVKAFLIMCLCGCAIAYGFNKDNDKMKKNVIAIGIAIAILVAASQLVSLVWDAAS